MRRGVKWWTPWTRGPLTQVHKSHGHLNHTSNRSQRSLLSSRCLAMSSSSHIARVDVRPVVSIVLKWRYINSLPFLSFLWNQLKTDVTAAIISRNFVAQLYRATKLQYAAARVAHCDKSHKRTKQTWLLVTLMMILIQSVYFIKYVACTK